MPRLDADFHARPPTPVFRVDDSMGTYPRRVEALAEVRFQRTTRKPYRELLDYYARGATAFDPEYAAVIEFLVRRDALGALDTLAFCPTDPDWLEFVKHCRLPSYGHKSPGNNYDIVFGPVFAEDDDTGAAIPEREQISFHTSRAIGALAPGQIHRVP